MTACIPYSDPARPGYTISNCWGTARPDYCPPDHIEVATWTQRPNFGDCGTMEPKTMRRCVKKIVMDDKLKWGCCTGATPGTQCDPNYCPGSNACNDYMRNRCDGKTLLTANGERASCDLWCANNKATCDAARAGYCRANIGDPACKEIASANGGFDVEVSAYCATYPDDPFCACVGEKNLYTGSDPALRVLNNPICFDSTCIKSGYKTASQRQFQCPTTLNVCGNSIAANAANASTIAANSQTCSINTGGSTDAIAIGDGAAGMNTRGIVYDPALDPAARPKTPAVAPAPPEVSPWLIIIIVFVVLSLVAAGVIGWYYVRPQDFE
jgi:hypothetical protein